MPPASSDPPARRPATPERRSGAAEPRAIGLVTPWTLVFVALAMLFSAVMLLALVVALGRPLPEWLPFCGAIAVAALPAGLILRWRGAVPLVWRDPPLGLPLAWAALFFVIGVLGPDAFRTTLMAIISICLSVRTLLHG